MLPLILLKPVWYGYIGWLMRLSLYFHGDLELLLSSYVPVSHGDGLCNDISFLLTF